MRKILIAVVAVILITSCGSKNHTEVGADIINNPNTASGSVLLSEKMPQVKFKQERIEFGDITQGEKVNEVFEFTNTGDADLIISNIYGSCGCTVPKDWPTKPVKPGESGSFKVTFDSEGKSGQQSKRITLLANTNPASNVVAISGNVIEPKKNN